MGVFDERKPSTLDELQQIVEEVVSKSIKSREGITYDRLAWWLLALLEVRILEKKDFTVLRKFLDEHSNMLGDERYKELRVLVEARRSNQTISGMREELRRKLLPQVRN